MGLIGPLSFVPSALAFVDRVRMHPNLRRIYGFLRQTLRENMDELHRSEDRRNSIREVLFAIEDRIHPLMAFAMRLHA